MTKMQKLKPDIVLKRYWSDNEQFADLFNGVLFAGEQIIRPEELEDVDTEESSVLEHRKYAEALEVSRDNIKIQKKSTVSGVQFVMLGLENQEHIHYAMPMRVMGYDYGLYKKQYDSNARKYKTSEGMSADEYLSRMRKTDKLTPVITVVVYYGENPWDGAKSLHGMLNIPEKMTQYVNDYKMLLVEARKNDLKLHNMNNRDLFQLLQIFLNRDMTKAEIRRKAIEYSKAHNIKSEVIMTLAGTTNQNIDYVNLERRADGMCTFFEELKKEGEAKGIVEAGRDFGLSETDILERLQKKLNLSLQMAQEYLEEFGKQLV